jgi:hypothetical protein
MSGSVSDTAPLCSGSKQPYCRFLPEDSFLDLFELGEDSEIQGLGIVFLNYTCHANLLNQICLV